VIGAGNRHEAVSWDEKLRRALSAGRGVRLGEAAVVSRRLHVVEYNDPGRVVVLGDVDFGRAAYGLDEAGLVAHIDVFHEVANVDHRAVAAAVRRALEGLPAPPGARPGGLLMDYVDLGTATGGGRLTSGLDRMANPSAMAAHRNHVHLAGLLTDADLALAWRIVAAVEGAILAQGVELRRIERLAHRRGGVRAGDSSDLSRYYGDNLDSYISRAAGIHGGTWKRGSAAAGDARGGAATAGLPASGNGGQAGVNRRAGHRSRVGDELSLTGYGAGARTGGAAAPGPQTAVSAPGRLLASGVSGAEPASRPEQPLRAPAAPEGEPLPARNGPRLPAPPEGLLDSSPDSLLRTAVPDGLRAPSPEGHRASAAREGGWPSSRPVAKPAPAGQWVPDGPAGQRTLDGHVGQPPSDGQMVKPMSDGLKEQRLPDRPEGLAPQEQRAAHGDHRAVQEAQRMLAALELSRRIGSPDELKRILEDLAREQGWAALYQGGGNQAPFLLRHLEEAGLVRREVRGMRLTPEGRELLTFLRNHLRDVKLRFRKLIRRIPGRGLSRLHTRRPGRGAPSPDVRYGQVRGTAPAQPGAWLNDVAVPETVIAAIRRTYLERISAPTASSGTMGSGRMSGDAAGGTPVRLRLDRNDIQVNLRASEQSLHVCLLIDASASMAGRRIMAAKHLARHLLVSTRDRIAVIAFQERDVRVYVPFTRDYGTVEEGLSRIQPLGLTPLAHGLSRSMELINSSRVRRPLLLLITDGIPTVPKWSADPLADAIEAARQLRAGRIPFGCIGLQPSRRYLEQLTREAGGTLHVVDELSEESLITIAHRERLKLAPRAR